MPWASTFILSIAWLFGPIDSGENEIALSGGFEQAGHVSGATNLEERGYTGHLEIISGIHENTWLSLNVPYGWTRRSVGGKLHYDRSGLRTLRIQIGRQIHENTHITLGFSTASIEFGTPVSERFPEARERFWSTRSRTQCPRMGRRISRRGTYMALGRPGALRLPRELDHSLTQAELYLLFRPGSYGLHIGPGCHFTRAISGEQILELKILERLELTEHWSFELSGFTQVLNVDSDSTTGLTGSIRWRG